MAKLADLLANFAPDYPFVQVFGPLCFLFGNNRLVGNSPMRTWNNLNLPPSVESRQIPDIFLFFRNEYLGIQKDPNWGAHRSIGAIGLRFVNLS